MVETETFERPELNTEEEYEKIRKELQKNKNSKHTPHYVLRLLHEKGTLRKTFLSTIKQTPAKISEISEDSLLSKPTCYSQLHKLLGLELIDRVFVINVMNDSVKNKEIKEKFIKWTENMPETLKRYYLAKTSYWVVTKYGKQFAVKSFNFEQRSE